MVYVGTTLAAYHYHLILKIKAFVCALEYQIFGLVKK